MNRSEPLGTPKKIKHENWTWSQTQSLANKLGLNATDLWENSTDQELSNLAEKYSTDVVEDLVKDLDTRVLVSIGITDPKDAKDILSMKYDLGLTDPQISELITEYGLTKTKEEASVMLKKLLKAIKPPL